MWQKEQSDQPREIGTHVEMVPLVQWLFLTQRAFKVEITHGYQQKENFRKSVTQFRRLPYLA